MSPVDDLSVRFVGRGRAEGRISDQALEHDGTKTPPVALLVVALLEEDLRGDVVWRSDSGVRLSVVARELCVKSRH